MLVIVQTKLQPANLKAVEVEISRMLTPPFNSNYLLAEIL
jgi:hypothetical protein